MKECRCKSCHKLLCKVRDKDGLVVEQPLNSAVSVVTASNANVVETVCPKCGTKNTFDI